MCIRCTEEMQFLDSSIEEQQDIIGRLCCIYILYSDIVSLQGTFGKSRGVLEAGVRLGNGSEYSKQNTPTFID